MGRLRIIGLTLLALAVPPFALGGEEAPAGPQALQVSASLGGCGIADAAIVCSIDTSWNSIEGAEEYAVSVTRPDGSVVDLGQSGGTARTLFIPYVGSGNYSIQVTAWGTPPGEEEPRVLARDRATSADGAARGSDGSASSRPGDAPAGEGRPAAEADGAAAGQPVTGGETPIAEPPPCLEPEPDGGADEDVVADEVVAAVAADALAEEVPDEQYDPGDADGDGGCPLSTSP